MPLAGPLPTTPRVARPGTRPPPPPGPPPQPDTGKTMRGNVFDGLMMYYAGAATPYGFGYALYHVPSPGGDPQLITSNHLGHFKPSSTHAYSTHTIKDTSSVSKSVSGLSMMKLISLVPSVAHAHHAMVNSGSAADTAAWRALVDHYYHLPLTTLASTATTMRASSAASKTGARPHISMRGRRRRCSTPTPISR